MKKYVRNPSWKTVKRILRGSEQRDSSVSKEDNSRDERGYLPMKFEIEGKKRSRKVLVSGQGTTKRPRFLVASMNWKITGEKQGEVDKMVAIRALTGHKEAFKKAGFRILDSQDLSKVAWLRLRYDLKYGKKRFTVVIEHEGSGRNFDLENSSGGYVHFLCCMKPEDCEM